MELIKRLKQIEEKTIKLNRDFEKLKKDKEQEPEDP